MYLIGQWYGLEYIWFAFPLSEVMSITPAAVWVRYKFKSIFEEMYKRKELDNQKSEEKI